MMQLNRRRSNQIWVSWASTILARWLMPEFPRCPMCLGDYCLIIVLRGAVASHHAGTGAKLTVQ